MKNKRYVVAFRRKREGKTDYRKRLKILVANKPRLVIRKSLKNILLQFAILGENGDLIVTSAHSNELEKYGWRFSKGNVSAAYLTGLIAGKKAKKVKISEAVLDMGLETNVRGSRMYAALKGVIDAGVHVFHSKDILPQDERIKGSHVTNYFKKIENESPDKLRSQFTAYVKNNANVNDFVKDFDAVKNKIIGEL